jgi:WD40 repeat protein
MLPRCLYTAVFASLVLTLSVSKKDGAAEPPARSVPNRAPLPPGAIARLGSVPWRTHYEINQMTFVPGGKYLVTKGEYSVLECDRSLSVWDLQTGRVLRTISSDGTPHGDGFADGFAFSSDGKFLLSADEQGERQLGGISGDPRRTSRLHLWNFASGKLQRQSPDLGAVPKCLAIRPDGRLVAYATYLGDVILWEPEKNTARCLVVGDRRTDIRSLTFTGDGKHLIVLPREGGVSRRIDVASGKVLKMVELGDCGRVALASDGGTIATYSYPDRLYLYHSLTGEKRRLPLKDKVDYLDLSFSPDGRTLLAWDRSSEVLQFWDTEKGRLLRRLHVPGISKTCEHAGLLLSTNGEWLASFELGGGGKFGALVYVWDARTGQLQNILPGQISAPVQLSFSADGKEVVSYAYRENSPSGPLSRWEIASGKLIARIFPDAPKEGTDDAPHDWLLAPAGRHLAAGVGRAIYLYDGNMGKRLVLTDKASRRSHWTFTPDGRAVVTIDSDQKVRLWDVTTGKLLRQLELDKKDWLTSWPRSISWIQFTPNGMTLTTCEDWRRVYLWDAATGKHRATLKLPTERDPFGEPEGTGEAAFSADGRYLFVSNNTNLWIWDLLGGKEIGPFEQDKHKRWRLSRPGQVTVSPDGRLVAWLDEAWRLRLYEVCTGKIVHRFPVDYSSIAFAPSGWRLATGCQGDASILIWDLPLLFRSQALSSNDTSAEALWNTLASNDAVQSHRALWRLAALPEADTFLARHLKPIETVPLERLRALLADLGSIDFATREKAEQALAAAGEPIRAALTEALAGSKDLEVRQRLQRLQERLQPLAPERLREIRAVFVLETRGTAEARRLLQRLAAGLSEARLTREAKAALTRLPK